MMIKKIKYNKSSTTIKSLIINVRSVIGYPPQVSASRNKAIFYCQHWFTFNCGQQDYKNPGRWCRSSVGRYEAVISLMVEQFTDAVDTVGSSPIPFCSPKMSQLHSFITFLPDGALLTPSWHFDKLWYCSDVNTGHHTVNNRLTFIVQ